MPSPIVNATVQAAVLSATSNLLAQAISAYRENSPFSIATTPLLQFVFFALLSTPPNFLWQGFLEDSFPGFTHPTKPAAPKTFTDEKGRETTITSQPVQAERKLNVRNTIIKFVLDQTLGAALNTVAFIGGMGAMKGLNGVQIQGAIKRDFWPLVMAGLKLWPLVSLMNFTVVPVDRRVVVGSAVGVAWGVYLSLMASGH